MNIQDYLYRAGSYAWHRLRSVNTLGYGIQSPSLYYIARMLIYDDNQYYCFQELEHERLRLLHNNKPLLIEDFGTGKSRERKVNEIARRSLLNNQKAQILFKLLQDRKPKHILELGTCLGLTTAYLAKGAPTAKVITMEGNKALIQEAQELWNKLNINNITPIVGNIDNTLHSVIDDTFDFVFIDANHTEQATKHYFDIILNCCHPKSIIVLDDIHYSHGMGKAWKYIKQHTKVRSTFDFYDIGMVFLNPEYLKKHYRLRL